MGQDRGALVAVALVVIACCVATAVVPSRAEAVASAPTDDQVFDDTPPQLLGLSITPASADLHKGDAWFTVTMRAADESGIGSGCVYFGWPAQPGSFDRACFTEPTDRIAGTSFNGTWRARLELLQSMPVGVYPVLDVAVIDAASNTGVTDYDTITARGFPNKVTLTRSKSRSGYWMLGRDGHVYPFGNAAKLGNATGATVAIATRLQGDGYWTVDGRGKVAHFGKAGSHGGNPALRSGESVSTISATPTGKGYWLFTDRGRAFAYGDAHEDGDLSAVTLNGAIVASVATPTGHGYFMVGADGGVFGFGDAHFHGSTGDLHINKPVVGIAPTPDNHGYWLVATDGGVFAFHAPFRGSMGATRLNQPVNGLVAFGNGYLMVASDGGIFDFSDRSFFGSLADNPPSAPIVGVTAFTT